MYNKQLPIHMSDRYWKSTMKNYWVKPEEEDLRVFKIIEQTGINLNGNIIINTTFDRTYVNNIICSLIVKQFPAPIDLFSCTFQDILDHRFNNSAKWDKSVVEPQFDDMMQRKPHFILEEKTYMKTTGLIDMVSEKLSGRMNKGLFNCVILYNMLPTIIIDPSILTEFKTFTIKPVKIPESITTNRKVKEDLN